MPRRHSDDDDGAVEVRDDDVAKFRREAVETARAMTERTGRLHVARLYEFRTTPTFFVVPFFERTRDVPDEQMKAMGPLLRECKKQVEKAGYAETAIS